MKKLQRFWGAAALTLVLSFPALAGDILCPGITSAPSQGATLTGEMQTPSASVAGQMDIPLVAETALTLMVNVLSAF